MTTLAIGTRTRRSPFYDSTIRAGASAFMTYNNMLLPMSYGNHEQEYRRLTTAVSIWDVAAERQVEIAGPDAFALANYLSARDLTGMQVGRARYAPMCDFDGRLINDPVVLRVGEERYWFSLADSQILLWARAIAGSKNYDVKVFEPDVSPLAIQGPLAIEVARDLFGAALVDSLGFFHHQSVELDGIPLVLCRSGWSKQGGFELFLTDGSQGNRLWELVLEAGEEYGIGPGGPNPQERVETGLLSYGADHDADTDPIEAGLCAYTSLDRDHDFVGRAALEERLTSSTRRNIVNVRFSGEIEAVNHPCPIQIDGEQVGMLRSAVWSSTLGAWIGLAQMTNPYDAPGTACVATLPSGRLGKCTVSAEPFGTNQLQAS